MISIVKNCHFYKLFNKKFNLLNLNFLKLSYLKAHQSQKTTFAIFAEYISESNIYTIQKKYSTS